MNYIVFDLEWNQGGTNEENKNLPFEIIEIAAIKLNNDFDIVSKFQRIIKPNVYKKLHPVIHDITGYKMSDLKKGVGFTEAVTEFIDWCGDDYIFCSWATQDLKELQMNMRFYDMSLVDKPPLYYYDVQKLFSFAFENGDDRRSLKYAVDYLCLDENVPFHRAYADAYYTAQVMKRIDFDKVKDKLSIDTFIIPKDRSEEILLYFEDYSKFISMGYGSKEELMKQKYITSVRCNYCKKYVKKKAGWFSDGMRNYYFAGVCKEHGKIKGKIRIRKNIDGKFYAIKTIKTVSDEEYDEILLKKQHITLKRKKTPSSTE